MINHNGSSGFQSLKKTNIESENRKKERYGMAHIQNYASKQSVNTASHYENMPIQIYRKFYLQKLKIFR